MTERLNKLFEQVFGVPPEQVQELSAHASNRRIFRLRGAQRSVIGILNSNQLENLAFLEFSRHFRGQNLPVPEIYGSDSEACVYLEEDLGDETLFQVLSRMRSKEDPFPLQIKNLYREVMSYLPRFQIVAGRTLNYDLCYPRKNYDREAMLWDMRFFRESFVRRAGITFDEARLESDFNLLASFLEEAPADFFMYRDFQSRNIMVRSLNDKQELFFIDYQSGRRGPLQYDVASLLYQSKAAIPAEVREELLEAYLDAAEHYVSFQRDEFRRLYYGFVLVRLLQVLGTYGEQGVRLQKTYFLESIPLGIKNVHEVASRLPLVSELSEMQRIFQTLFIKFDINKAK